MASLKERVVGLLLRIYGVTTEELAERYNAETNKIESRRVLRVEAGVEATADSERTPTADDFDEWFGLSDAEGVGDGADTAPRTAE